MQDVNSSPISCLLNYYNLLLYDLKPLHIRILPPYQSQTQTHTHTHTHTLSLSLSLSLIITVYGCFFRGHCDKILIISCSSKPVMMHPVSLTITDLGLVI